jgi:propionyl-CoA carboxylase alpha chain
MNGFAPDIGTLKRYRIPVGEHIRVDDAYQEGMEIPIFYDPMIAKLVVWAEDREKAIVKMIDAISTYQIAGIKNNLDFCVYVLKHPAFTSGDFDTNFVKKYFNDPKIIYTSMEEEKEALLHAVENIWDSLKKRKEDEYVSKPIHGAWKLMVR